MKVLLDTCTYIWMLQDSPSLSPTARKVLSDGTNDVYLSAVSVWELLVKESLGGISITGSQSPESFVRDTLIRYGLVELPLSFDAIWQLPRLPHHHRDPFDRMLICQAISQGLTLLTSDPAIYRYTLRVLW